MHKKLIIIMLIQSILVGGINTCYTSTDLAEESCINIDQQIQKEKEETEKIRQEELIKQQEREVAIIHENEKKVVSSKYTFPKYKNMPLSDDILQYTYDLCRQYDIQYEIVLGIMYRESRFNPNLISEINYDGSYDKGICQQNSYYMKEFSKVSNNPNYNPLNVYDNIKACICQLDFLRKELAKQGIYDQRAYILSYGLYIPRTIQYIRNHGYNHEDVMKVYNFVATLELMN